MLLSVPFTYGEELCDVLYMCCKQFRTGGTESANRCLRTVSHVWCRPCCTAQINRKRDLAFKVQKQRKRNNEFDMSHAHAVEYFDIQARVPGLKVQPRKHFMKKASTFKGESRGRRRHCGEWLACGPSTMQPTASRVLLPSFCNTALPWFARGKPWEGQQGRPTLADSLNNASHLPPTAVGSLLCRDLAKTHTPGSWGGVLAVMDMQNTATEVEYRRLTMPEKSLHLD